MRMRIRHQAAEALLPNSTQAESASIRHEGLVIEERFLINGYRAIGVLPSAGQGGLAQAGVDGEQLS